ncbi:MAG: stage III sporulation protein AA [Sporolactobacillus sp.]
MTLQQILPLLPENISKAIAGLPASICSEVEEIRCRSGQPIELIVSGCALSRTIAALPTFSARDAEEMMQRIGHYSLYTLEEELRCGFVTVRGGHRIGLAGHVITERGKVLRLREVTFFNIRLARERIGVAGQIIPYIFQNSCWLSTLIIGAPLSGKTTLLRDLARQISDGVPALAIAGRKTAIVDERSELAGCIAGVPQNDIGARSDVLDACPKAEGMMMMIRSMSPDVLIVDEIGNQADADALQEAMNAGVVVMATAHGGSLKDIRHRPAFESLLSSGVFSRFAVLNRKNYGPQASGANLLVTDASGRVLAAQEPER